MKRAARIGGWTALAVLALATSAAAVLLAPPVQRALLRRALSHQGLTAVDLGNFHASPFGLAADRLAGDRAGWHISARAVVLRWRLGPLLRQHLLAVTELSGREVEISQDTAETEAPPAGSPRPSPAAAAPPAQNFGLSLEQVDVAGRWLVRRGPQTLQSGDWTLRGSGLGTGKTGEVAYTLAWQGPGISPTAVATSRGRIRLSAGPAGPLPHLTAELAAEVVLPAVAQARAEVAPLGEIRGQVSATLQGGDAPWTLSRAAATLAPAVPGTALHLTLLQPLTLSPWHWPDGDLLALGLEHVPLSWANPWLASAHFAFPAGQVDGSARLAAAGGRPVLTALQLAFGAGPGAPPQVTVALGQPLPLTAAEFAALRDASIAADVVRIHVHDLPLAWVSRWLPPGHVLTGRLTEGASDLHTVPGQGLEVTTVRPWRLQNFHFLVGEQDFFHGDLQVSPQLRYGRDAAELQLTDFDGADRAGNRLRGRVHLERRAQDGRLSADTQLILDLPALPHSAETFGPLQVTLAAAGRLHWDEERGDLSKLALTVADRQGRTLVAIQSDRPVRVERTPQAEWLVSAADPLRFQTGALPLVWLNPFLSGEHVVLAGELQPTAMSLRLAPRSAQVVSTQPIAVGGFHFARGGETLLDGGEVHCGTAFDLELTHSLLPELHFTYTARLAITDGRAAAGGADVSRFTTRLWFAGTEKGSTLTGAAGTLWADLGALGRLPLFAAAHLPARGELDLALSKVEHRADAIAVEAKLTRIQGRDGRDAPNLEISGRAHVDPGARVGALRIKTTLASAPRPSDAAFVLKVDNQDLSVVDSTSVLTCDYLDFDAIRGFAAAFAPDPQVIAARRSRTAAAAPAKPAAKPAGAAAVPEPAWGNFRGQFTLQVKTLAFDGYTLENLSGRLALTNDTFSLSHLSGDVFGAHWTSALTAHFHPGDPAGEHQLSAQFSLRQLDAGKVLALRFPRQAPTIDARLDLALAVTSQANNLNDLFAHTSGKFSLAATGGKIRLSLPGQDMRSTIKLLGTVTFSPELRALSRLIGELAEMPLSRCEASGQLAQDGRLTLEQLHIEAPQLRLDIAGGIPDAKSSAFATQPLAAHAFLEAHGDIAVILGGMGLLGRPQADGFRPITAPFGVTGTVGQPDLRQLYDLLARAVSGSKGTWGLLMRKLGDKIKAPPAS